MKEHAASVLGFLPWRCSGPGSSVSIATDYGLDGPGIESQCGEIFALLDWLWGPPSLLYNGYGVFPGGKVWPGCAADNSSPSRPWSWKIRAIPPPTLWATPRPVMGTLYLYPEGVGSRFPRMVDIFVCATQNYIPEDIILRLLLSFHYYYFRVDIIDIPEIDPFIFVLAVAST